MTNNSVEINNVALGIKEYEGQRVVTFKDIDLVHERLSGTARKAFNRNKKRLIEGRDYYMAKHNVHEKDISGFTVPNRGLTVVTESGYLLLVKVFDDDIAWEVQRKLISVYFRAEENSPSDISLTILQAVVESLHVMHEEISSIKQSQEQIQKQLPKKKFSSWTSKMFPKYQLLMDYFGVDRKELYHNLYIEFANTYPDIDLNQEHDDYCFENGLDSCFTLDIIEHNKKLRELFTQMTNNLLKKYSLCDSDENEYQRRETIFNQIT